jgi:uracil-DNA glycosylase
MLDLERKVHNCTKCKKEQILKRILKYPPVYSFGDPSGKDFIVVGQNPSDKEYENNILKSDRGVARRRKSQLTYFERESIHPFFIEIRSFFEAEVKKRMGWVDSPWEKVGYLDLVKCPTRCPDGQWSKIGPKPQRLLIKNCGDYLKRQLAIYKPKMVLAYGADVGEWFKEEYLNLDDEDLKYEDRRARLDNKDVHLLFVPQRQGPHSKPEIFWIRKKILGMIDSMKVKRIPN